MALLSSYLAFDANASQVQFRGDLWVRRAGKEAMTPLHDNRATGQGPG
jgi:hypothetical protein